jgi:hypothetical protein
MRPLYVSVGRATLPDGSENQQRQRNADRLPHHRRLATETSLFQFFLEVSKSISLHHC